MNDLAADAGHILDVDHPEVRALVNRAQDGALQAGLKVGTVPTPKRGYASLFREGFDVVLPVGDVGLLRDAVVREIEAFRLSGAAVAQSIG